MPAAMTLGERIRQVRDAKGLTQEDVAAKMDVDATTVGDYERALDLKDGKLRRLAEVLEVSKAYLTGDNPELCDLGVVAVVKRESLRLFLETTDLGLKDRKGFERIRDHALAGTTVARWRELWHLIQTYQGRPPIKPEQPPSAAATAEQQPSAGVRKKRMAAAAAVRVSQTSIRRVG